MIKVHEAPCEAEAHSDPDTDHGIEERIYFEDGFDALDLLHVIHAAAKSIKMNDLYVCMKARDNWRGRKRLAEAVKDHGEWRGRMMFEIRGDSVMYLSARPRFDQEKLILLMMKLPPKLFC